MLLLSPCSGSAENKEALSYFQQGVIFYDQGKYEQALTALEKAIELDGKLAEAFYNQGIIYDLQGKYHQAIQAYEKVIQLDPNIGHVWENMAQDCYLTGQLIKGMDYIKVAESRGEPIDKDLYNEMWGKVKAGKVVPPIRKEKVTIPSAEAEPIKQITKELELTILSLERELNQDNKEGPSPDLINLGIKYRQKGELDRSIELFTKSLSLKANNALVLAELSLCHYFKDQNDLFVEYFSKAKQAGFQPSRSLNDLFLQQKAKK